MSYEDIKIYTENYLNTISKSTDDLVPDVAAVIIMRNNKALILQRGSTAPWMPLAWNLPGGGIDEGETPEQAARREAKEETDIDLEGYSLVSLGKEEDKEGWVLETFMTNMPLENKLLPDSMLSKSERNSLLPYTSIKDKFGNTKEIQENTDYLWISFEELNNYDFVPKVKEKLRKAFEA